MSQLKYTHANPTDPWDRKLPDHHYPGPEDSKCHGSSTSTWQYLASTKEKIQVPINPATGPEKSYWCYQAVKPSTPASSPHMVSTPDFYPRLRFRRDLPHAFQSTPSKWDIKNNMLPDEITTLCRRLRFQYLERALFRWSTHSRQDIKNNMLPEEIATLYSKQIIDIYIRTIIPNFTVPWLWSH